MSIQLMEIWDKIIRMNTLHGWDKKTTIKLIKKTIWELIYKIKEWEKNDFDIRK